MLKSEISAFTLQHSIFTIRFKRHLRATKKQSILPRGSLVFEVLIPTHMIRRVFIIIVLVAAIGTAAWYFTRPPTGDITLTGIVTTDDVAVSPQIRGRLQHLLVKEGDEVKAGQLLAEIQPEEQMADVEFFNSSHQEDVAQMSQAEAELEYAQLTFDRDQALHDKRVVSQQDYDQAKTNLEAAKAHLEMMRKADEAAQAQQKKSQVQLGYTKIVAPISAIVDTRDALQGEVVNIGQPIVTLIDPDDLWVRADVEETYIDRIRLGQTLKVKLPSGDVLDGTVFYRGVDADYATQRDVSRTKRDIRTFEIRLRCDNHDRRLAVGMTAYVTLPLGNP
jgi:RND family efflux transporter MFP subunit